MSGIDRPLENIGTTLQATGVAPEFGQTLKDLTDAPANYESASDRFINPQEGDFTIGGFAPEYLPRAVVEQAGNLRWITDISWCRCCYGRCCNCW